MKVKAIRSPAPVPPAIQNETPTSLLVRSDLHIITRQGLQLNQLELAFFLQHWMGLPIKLNRRTELPRLSLTASDSMDKRRLAERAASLPTLRKKLGLPCLAPLLPTGLLATVGQLLDSLSGKGILPQLDSKMNLQREEPIR